MDRVVDSAMFSKDYSTSGCKTPNDSKTGILEVPVNDNLTPPAPTSILHLLPGETMLTYVKDVPTTAENVKIIRTIPQPPIPPEPPPNYI